MSTSRLPCPVLAIVALLSFWIGEPQSVWAAEGFHPKRYDARGRGEDDAKGREGRDVDAVAKAREPWRNQDLTNKPRAEFRDANQLLKRIEAQKKADATSRQSATQAEQSGRETNLSERLNQTQSDASKLKGRLAPEKSPTLDHVEITNRTRPDIEELARQKGLVQDKRRAGKYLDPVTNRERLRIDDGHIDKETGLPYSNANAAAPHVHGYSEDGSKIVHPETKDPHFPLREKQ